MAKGRGRKKSEEREIEEVREYSGVKRRKDMRSEEVGRHIAKEKEIRVRNAGAELVWAEGTGKKITPKFEERERGSRRDGSTATMAYVWRTAGDLYKAMGRQGILGEEVGADDEELGRHLSVITVLKRQSWVPKPMLMRWMKTYFTKFASNFFEDSEKATRMLVENGVVVSGALIRSFLLNDRKPVPGRRRNHARAHLDLFVGSEKYKETVKWLCSAENGWKRTRKEDNTGQRGVQARIRYLKGGYVGRVTRLVKVTKENKSRCWRMDVVGCGSFMTTQAALRFEECCGDKEHGCRPVMWVLMPPVERITDQSLELMGEIRENLIERVGGAQAMAGGNGKWMDVGAKRIGGGITWSTGAEAVDGVKPEEYRWLNGEVLRPLKSTQKYNKLVERVMREQNIYFRKGGVTGVITGMVKQEGTNDKGRCGGSTDERGWYWDRESEMGGGKSGGVRFERKTSAPGADDGERLGMRMQLERVEETIARSVGKRKSRSGNLRAAEQRGRPDFRRASVGTPSRKKCLKIAGG
ncbi:hypothetical protein SISNIDRAFT_516053 [Sistotremastrum niveocremeum HHB9708]|uniref:Uncharacterized protein n=1 Tax=Sistotremastrum niveocremeum HHB9708 TaxID=1314777 RepID=A0A164SJ86_9AGAM|nr:hypothetical protein SISNIDRAFT_516053 [Sistotremastrum niveocremeum HHB9708]